MMPDDGGEYSVKAEHRQKISIMDVRWGVFQAWGRLWFACVAAYWQAGTEDAVRNSARRDDCQRVTLSPLPEPVEGNQGLDKEFDKGFGKLSLREPGGVMGRSFATMCGGWYCCG